MRRRHLPVFSFLPIIFLGAVLAVGFWFWQSGKFGKFDRFNLVLATRPVTFISLDNRQGLATVITFPDDLFVSEVVPKLGGYKMAQVYKVGELDKRGGQVLSWTVEELLGVPVDGYLYKDAEMTSGVKTFFLNPGVLFASKTNLNPLDLGKFVYTLLQIRADRMKVIDLGVLATPLLLADGSQGLGIDKELLDGALNGDFFENRLQDEKLRVEVVNSTPASGLGARAARILTNIGVTVVNVGTVTLEEPKCEIRVEKKNQTLLTVNRIAGLWQCKIVPEGGGRADVSVILGTDYAGRF